MRMTVGVGRGCVVGHGGIDPEDRGRRAARGRGAQARVETRLSAVASAGAGPPRGVRRRRHAPAQPRRRAQLEPRHAGDDARRHRRDRRRRAASGRPAAAGRCSPSRAGAGTSGGAGWPVAPHRPRLRRPGSRLGGRHTTAPSPRPPTAARRGGRSVLGRRRRPGRRSPGRGADEAWAAGAEGTLLHTVGGGPWSRVDLGTDLDLTAATFVDQRDGLGGRRGPVRGGAGPDPSHDGRRRHLDAPGRAPVGAHPRAVLRRRRSRAGRSGEDWGVDGDVASGVVLATRDGGATWQEQPTLLTEVLRAVSFADELHGWAVGDVGAVTATTDGGETWLPQDSGTGTAPDAASPRCPPRRPGSSATTGAILTTSNGGGSAL